jgi:glycosyltransferase XagB
MKGIVNPIMWIMTILYFASRNGIGVYITAIFPIAVYYFAISSLVFGNFLYVLYYLIGVAKRNDWYLIKWYFFIPFYWLLMSIAAWVALYQLALRPFHWEKTQHGLHLNGRNNLPNRYPISS